MTCTGCTRPPGMSDEAVREVLRAVAQLHWDGLPLSAGGAGTDGPWHVVAWHRCRSRWGAAASMMSRDERCFFPAHHGGCHESEHYRWDADLLQRQWER